jgi:hypothetical protein
VLESARLELETPTTGALVAAERQLLVPRPRRRSADDDPVRADRLTVAAAPACEPPALRE